MVYSPEKIIKLKTKQIKHLKQYYIETNVFFKQDILVFNPFNIAKLFKLYFISDESI